MDFVHSPGISRASGNSTGTHEKRILSCCWQWRRGGAGTETSRKLGGMSSEAIARKALMGSFWCPFTGLRELPRHRASYPVQRGMRSRA